MSILFSRRPAAEQRAIDLSSWIVGDGSWQSTIAGENVTPETALGLAAVSRAVSLLTDLAATLPVDVFRNDATGTPTAIDPAPLLIRRPSLRVSPRVWKSQAMISFLLHGNAWGMILETDGLGWPTMVEWLDPASVQAEESNSLAPLTIRVNGVIIPRDRILHVPGKHVRPGSALGVAPLERFRETLGLALAARNFGASWFGNGGHPSAILSSDQKVTEEQAKTIKERFLKATRRKREPAVLGAGLKYDAIQATPEESQFLATSDAIAVDVARAFDLPPEALGAAVRGSSISYANREQRVQDLLAFGADPWLVVLENDVYTANLPNKQFAKFNRGAILRADLRTRYEAHASALASGWLSVNEVRALEDRPPIDGGDEFGKSAPVAAPQVEDTEE